MAGDSLSTTCVSDSELVRRAQAGDRDAFDQLVERYQNGVYRAALAALGSPADAEEVAQDAFLAAFRKLGDFRGEASFKTWILAIAWRRALDRRQSIGQWLRRLMAPGPEATFDPPSPGRSQEDRLLDAELKNHVRRLVRTLPRKYRDVLLLTAAGDYTMDEIGAMLRVPSGTVKWRAMEGRRQLKQKLAALGYGHG